MGIVGGTMNADGSSMRPYNPCNHRFVSTVGSDEINPIRDIIQNLQFYEGEWTLHLANIKYLISFTHYFCHQLVRGVWPPSLSLADYLTLDLPEEAKLIEHYFPKNGDLHMYFRLLFEFISLNTVNGHDSSCYSWIELITLRITLYLL